MLPSFADAFDADEHDAFTLNGGAKGALLIHGYPGTPAEMRPLADALHVQNWTVSAPLLPGFGKEIDTLAKRTHQEWLEAVASAYEDLSTSTESQMIIGFSMGGAIAINIAATYQPEKLVLLAPFWQINHVLWKALPVLRIIFPKIKPFRIFKPDFDDPKFQNGVKSFTPDADLNDPQVREAIRDFELPISMFNQIRILGEKGYAAAPNVKSQTLVIQGKEDDLVQTDLTRRLITRFPQKAQLAEVPSDHNLLDDSHQGWSTIKQHILSFTQTFEDKATI